MCSAAYISRKTSPNRNLVNFKKNRGYCVRLMLYLIA